MASLNPFRRQPPLVAAATQVDLSNASAIKAVLKRREKWQKDAFDCADAQTEILTIDGWRFHDHLQAGDLVMTLDHQKGTMGWEPVQAIHRYEVQGETLLHLEKRSHSSLTTLNHRWPVLKHGYIDGRRTGTIYPSWATSGEMLKGEKRIRTAGVYREFPTQQKYSDAFVELMAWFYTEGSIRTSERGSSFITISQSQSANPVYVERIRAVLVDLFGEASTRRKVSYPSWTEAFRPEHAMAVFRLNRYASQILVDIAPEKVVPLSFILDLTRSQLEIFIETSIAADGAVNKGIIRQVDSRRLDALELAVILSGKTPRSTQQSCGMRALHVSQRTYVVPRKRNERYVENYTGTVWCPTTPSGTWMARREGTVYFTGNSYESCGELAYGIDFLASLMSRLTFFPATQPKTKEDEPQAATDEQVNKVFERLGSPVERANLQRDLAVHLLLPGESWLIALQPGPNRPNDREVWIAASIEEMEFKDEKTVYLKGYGEDGADTPLTSGKDTWIRIWRQHARNHQKAFSHVRPILDAIDELLWWDAAARARAKSRLSDAGILAIPSNMELPAEKDEDRNLSGVRRLLRKLLAAFAAAISNPASAEAAVPIVVTYPVNDRGRSGIEYIALNRPQDELLEKRTERALRRIAQGLNIPVEIIFGLGQATHWGGGSIEQSVFREHVEPLALLMVSALTNAYFIPTLRAAGVQNPEQYLIWYDETNLIVYPQKEQAADHGVELGAIGFRAWRRARGFSETDAPTPEERLEILETLQARRGQAYQPTVSEGLPKPGQEGSDPNQPPVQPAAPGERGQNPQPPAPARGKGQSLSLVRGSGNGNGHTPHPNLGRRLAEIDADLFTRLQVACDSSMYRALERAGTQLRTRAQKNPTLRASLRNVAAEDVAFTLGRENVVKLGYDGLFDDAFNSVPSFFRKWCDRAVDAAFASASLELAEQKKAIFDLSYATDEAAAALVRDLKELANTYLFDRARGADIKKPEMDDSLIPAVTIRKALNKAGGGQGKTLLLATGHAVSSALSEAGFFPSSYEWWYGPSIRHPFVAHEQMDGHSFSLTDSPHLPGDTEHCRCIAVPVFE